VGLNLHCHLEGCVRPSTAADIAREHGIPDPGEGWESAFRMDAPADLTVFLAHVAAAYPVMGFAGALRRIAREAVEDAAAGGDDYLEIRFGPATHRRPDLPIDEVIRAVRDGLAEGSRATGLPTGLVVCLLRHSDRETNLDVARAAAGLAGDGVVGLDVAGDELRWPSNEAYVEPYRIASAAGLGLTAHAAEASPAGAAREAAEWLGATRIGHGTHVADDPDALRWAVDHGLTFEVCATSNVFTGVARSLREHPIHAFLAAGARVVLGNDNPTQIGRSLADEERDLVVEGGLSQAQLDGIHRASVAAGFMDDGVRARLARRFGATGTGQALS
jgi:adenosine deaminase